MKTRWVILYSVIGLLLVLLLLVNICVGSSEIGPSEIYTALIDHDTESTQGIILWSIRLPRVIAAAVLGGALALSGYLLQAFFANPIAGPYVLGISSGAKLVVALLMVAAYQYDFLLSSGMMVAAAFAGSVAATLLVLLAAGRVKNMSILVVCGVMIGYICSALTELLVSFAQDSNIVNLHNWSQGSFASVSWSNVRSFSLIVVPALAAAWLLSKGIEAYLYGEDYAFHVGMNVKGFRLLLILVSSLLSATVTAFAGPVSFVGIAVPHMVRLLFKTSKPRVLISASFLLGAVFCLFCDLLARRLFAPTELSISTITAIFGAPVVISMLLKKRGGVS